MSDDVTVLLSLPVIIPIAFLNSKMEELTHRPALSVKILARLVRWSAWLLLAAMLIFSAAWAGLHFFIVPRIAEFRPALESRASQALGLQVKIGDMQADAALLFPTFTLTDVRLHDAQDLLALSLPKVVATLSPMSLWNLGFDRLYIERPQLDIRRSVQGQLFIAGLAISTGPDATSQTSDWIFSQTELVIQSGRLQWTDEMMHRPTLSLNEVDLVVRNGWRRHDIELNATPPEELGQRIRLKAGFDQHWLSSHAGQWELWEGQLEAAFERVDVAHLQRYTSLGLDVSTGTGALHAWVDIQDGTVTGVMADVTLSEVNLVMGEKRTPVELNSLSGRLGGKLFDGGFEFFTQNLKFEMQDGLNWSGGSFRVSHLDAVGDTPEQGELSGERLELETLARIAKRLPIAPSFQSALDKFAPKGQLNQVQASWQGPLEAVIGFSARGRLMQLEVQAASGLPGIQGLNLNFDLNQNGGKADVQITDGKLELPGWFEDPVISLTQLSADLSWQIKGEQIAVQSNRLRLSNADAQGEAHFNWRTAEPRAGEMQTRYPGVLDLQGSLSRAEGAQVHRYLPLVIGQSVRHYVRDAVTAGQSGNVRFRLRGDLSDMPFDDPQKGEFRISAAVKNADFAYVPVSLQGPQDLPWPALTQVSGNLVFDRSSMQLQGVNARLAAAPELAIGQGEAKIADMLRSPVVQVGLEFRGPLSDIVKTVLNGSPLDGLIDHALEQTSTSGYAQGQLQLQLPLQALEKSKVLGQIRLFGNEFQFTPDLPRLSALRGVVHFNERGFALSGVQARALGGEMTAEGGMIEVPGTKSRQAPLLRIQGNMSAEGLRQASYLGPIASLGQKARGRTSYNGSINWSRGAAEMLFSSNLQGLALELPSPFDKQAQSAMPLTFATELTSEWLKAKPADKKPMLDQLSVSLGQVLAVRYIRDISTARSRVLRGAIGVGPAAIQSLPMPEDGVLVQLKLEALDMDVWRALMMPDSATTTNELNTVTSGYLPSMFSVQAEALKVGAQKFNQVVAGGARIGRTWQANLDAREFSGYVEYRQPINAQSGRVYGRLARVALAHKEANEVESLLDEQSVNIPSLDIVIDDFELLGKKLGRLEIEADNLSAVSRDAASREWRLKKLNVILPEATFTASGNWAVVNEPLVRRGATVRRRTTMNFVLDMNDAGELLARLGMKDVIRRGKGKMEGQVNWTGSPLALDYPSLGGAFYLSVENGQFLKTEPGLAKLLGVLSLQALPRRLSLDFRDVFSAGFSFDFIRGDVQIQQGVARTNNLQMKGVNAAVLMEGQADIGKETQDIKVVVVPEINAGTASLIATVINPAVGLGTFLAQLILRRPLIESATQEFSITGSWADPKIVRANEPVQAQPAETLPMGTP
jgi:uncharacterized protein (TIGR02099 family)